MMAVENTGSESRSSAATIMVGRYDMTLMGAVLALASIGSLLVFSTSINPGQELTDAERLAYLNHHLVSIGLGAVAFVIARHIGPELLARLAVIALVAGAPLIVAMKFIPGFASDKGGSRRWLDIFGMSFQPTELLKVAWAIFMARFMDKHQTDLNNWRRCLVWLLLFCAVVAGPIAILPDVGTAVIIGGTMIIMMFVTGLNWKNIGIFVSTALVAGIVIFIFDRVKLFRIAGWLFPDETRKGIGFHLDQAVTTIGSGGLFGKGLGHGKYHILDHLPESSTDFIVSVAAEELGFAGLTVIALLYAVIAVRGYSIARMCEDRFRRNLAFVLTVLMVMPAALHMSVNVGLVPTKGLVCPFMSYGGTAMIVALGSLGILQRIYIDETASAVEVRDFIGTWEKDDTSGEGGAA